MMLWLLAVATTFAVSSAPTKAAITMKIEVLGNQMLPNAPSIPDITGPFYIDVVARFDDLSGGNSQTLFHFYRLNNQNNIYLMQNGNGSSNVTFCYSDDANTHYCLHAVNGLTVGSLDKWRVGVSINGLMTMHKNGVLIDSIPVPVPTGSVVRPNKLIAADNWVDSTPFVGAVLGFDVRNLNNPEPAYRSLMNLQSQIRRDHFVASVYARFDDLSRRFQKIIDFGNGENSSNIGMSQNATNNQIYINAVQDGMPTVRCTSPVTAAPEHSIVEGEMALWKFEMEGTTWRIEKNGVQVQECTGMVIPKSIFRTDCRFGESHWVDDDKLRGVVLGFRLDVI